MTEHQTVRLALRGLKCAGCASAVESLLDGVVGVTAASVSYGNESADVAFDPDTIDLAGILQAIERAGYGASVSADQADAERAAAQRAEMRVLALRLAVSVPLALVLMLGMVGPGLSAGWQAALALPVWAWGGWPYHVGAWHALRRRRADMSSLISLGSSVAYVASLLAWLGGHAGHHALYFDTAAMIVAFILLGRYLEAAARHRTGGELRALLDMRPRTARRLADGVESELAVDQVRVGDHLVVRPGELLPVDGTIVSGAGSLDESAVTGESVPVTRGPGEAVMGGTLNLTGALVLEATAVGADSVLGRMIALVRQAQGTKAPVQRLADRVAAVFVPVVVGLAGLTCLGWLHVGVAAAITRAVAVLVVACPCAVGLATPTAIIVACGRGARLGLLLKGGAVLETAARVTLVAFDKTGTLTQGSPAVRAVEPLSGSADELLALAAAAEAGSEHPYGRAVVAAAAQRGLTVAAATEFAAQAGSGVSALVESRRVVVGRVDDGPLLPAASRLAAQAVTPLGVTVDDEPRGVLGVADVARPEAATEVARLRAAGLKVAMLTGDDAAVASAIARQIGLDEVQARLLPDGKGEALRRWQAAGEVVAMVGDGINDAPALALADVGIAVAGGTDVALEAGDIALLRDGLSGVGDALALSRAALRTIRGNLAWAFGYNLVMLPAAALLNFDPMWAAAAMALSSVSVVANSLRLRGWRPTGAR